MPTILTQTTARATGFSRGRPPGQPHDTECRRGARVRDRHPARDRERGSVAAQVVIAMLVLVVLVLGIVQVTLAAYANHIAQGAAEQALDAARVLGGTSTDGQDEAQEVLAQLATGPLVDAHVTVTRTATTVTVTITGRAERVWLGPSLPVHASATGVIERFST